MCTPPFPCTVYNYIDVIVKVNGPFVQTFCIKEDSYMDAI